MKQFLFAILSALLFASCGQKENSQVDGGWKYEGIYIFENGVFSNAHKHEVHFPKEGGEQEILLSTNMFTNFYPQNNSGISFTISPSTRKCDGIFEKTGEAVSLTVWPTKIVASPSDNARTLIFGVMNAFYDSAAEIVVKQE